MRRFFTEEREEQTRVADATLQNLIGHSGEVVDSEQNALPGSVHDKKKTNNKHAILGSPDEEGDDHFGYSVSRWQRPGVCDAGPLCVSDLPALEVGLFAEVGRQLLNQREQNRLLQRAGRRLGKQLLRVQHLTDHHHQLQVRGRQRLRAQRSPRGHTPSLPAPGQRPTAPEGTEVTGRSHTITTSSRSEADNA